MSCSAWSAEPQYWRGMCVAGIWRASACHCHITVQRGIFQSNKARRLVALVFLLFHGILLLQGGGRPAPAELCIALLYMLLLD